MDIKNYIKIFDAVIPYPTLANLIKFVNTKNFEKAEVIGTSGHEVNMSIRNTFNISIDINSESMTDVHWLNLLTLIIKTHMRSYTEKVSGDPNKIFVKKIIDIQLLKYIEGGFYNYHVDHCATIPRTLSAIFLLNNDYEGGELCFRDPNDTNEIKIDVIPNRVIIWPSNFLYPHCVKPVKKGTRYSVVAWGL